MHNNFHTFVIKEKPFVYIPSTSYYSPISNNAKLFLDKIKELGFEQAFNYIKEELGAKESLEIYSQITRLDCLIIDTPPLKKLNNLKTIELHVSHRCNLTCSYCFAQQGNYGGESVDMDIKTAKKSIDFLFLHADKNSKLNITFFGGEPLLNMDVIKASIQYAKEKALSSDRYVSFSMTTNGVLLNDKTKQYLADENVSITVSVDGPKKIHDEYRKTNSGRGSFDIIKKNLKNADNNRIFLRGTHANEEHDLSTFQSAFSELGNFPSAVIPVGAAKPKYFDAMVTEHEKILELEIKKINDGLPNQNSAFSWVERKLDSASNKIQTPCGAGTSMLAVTPDGSLYLCHRFALNDKFKFGSVWDDSYTMNDLAPPTVSEMTNCKSCWARNVCKGSCYHDHYESTGDIKKSDYHFCRYFHKLLEQTIYLKHIKESNLNSQLIFKDFVA